MAEGNEAVVLVVNDEPKSETVVKPDENKPAGPKVWVLYFRRGKNPKTDEPQWQATIKVAGVSTILIPHKDGPQPMTPEEVWFCHEGSVISESKGQVVKVVLLKKKLFDSEFKLKFDWSAKHQVWSAKNPAFRNTVFNPDKCGRMPDQDKKFWFCRFRMIAHLKTTGDGEVNFMVAIVDLLREDEESNLAYQAELKATIAMTQESLRNLDAAERRANKFVPPICRQRKGRRVGTHGRVALGLQTHVR